MMPGSQPTIRFWGFRMISSKTIYVILSGLLLVFSTTSSYAATIEDERDLAILPEYCLATQVIRSISKLPKSAYDNNVKIYGDIYPHLHHYCWALIGEFKANTRSSLKDRGLRNTRLQQALRDIQYVFNKNPPETFKPLAEIYTTRARILVSLNRSGEAVGDLIRAINLQPGYQRAYAQLSDIYVRLGKKDKAIATLEKGVENNESPKILLRELERLGKPYKGTPGSAVAKKQEMGSPAPGQDSTGMNTPQANESSPSSTSPVDESPKVTTPEAVGTPSDIKSSEPSAPNNTGNPYCRFCP